MKKASLFIASTLMLTGAYDVETFTLNRPSAVLENARLRVATFDADGSISGSQYNRANCLTAANPFKYQPRGKERF
ncbi:hypothetical protein [Caballeronia zhejiangensis]|uniref:hypothetical protein n=1 Tax=Caballeronia zhejiangensis TaxID=871203 RepID=UPI001F521C40|nr:hypothetical protein [Caballeronia zhejiangensis]MCI1047815.1 hypothetical protein [Caballeronia zhejiangensis]